MELTPAMERYVLHWGEMGTRWGVNRSVAQIHALLYLSPAPMQAETIAETLGIARSNVSTSLKELQSWDLISRVHVMGDRRDHFSAVTDTWETLTLIVEGRKRREIDPTLTMLRDVVLEARADGRTPGEVRARLEDMLGFMETLADWYQQVRKLPRKTLISLVKMGAKVSRMVAR